MLVTTFEERRRDFERREALGRVRVVAGDRVLSFGDWYAEEQAVAAQASHEVTFQVYRGDHLADEVGMDASRIGPTDTCLDVRTMLGPLGGSLEFNGSPMLDGARFWAHGMMLPVWVQVLLPEDSPDSSTKA